MGDNEPIYINYRNVTFTGYTENDGKEDKYLFQVTVPPTSPLYSKLKEPDIKGMCDPTKNSTILDGKKLEQETNKLYEATKDYVAAISTRPAANDTHPEIAQSIQAKYNKAVAAFEKNTTYAAQPATARAVVSGMNTWAQNNIGFIRGMNQDDYLAKNNLHTTMYVTDPARTAAVPSEALKNGPANLGNKNMIPITPQEYQKRTAIPQ